MTLPNIKWGLLYGVILANARAMGEFGAVSVGSGHIRGEASTLPATPVFSSVFGEQAWGGVVDAVALPDGSADLIAVVQLAAVESGDVHVGAPDGPLLEPLPLPYALPASAPKRVKL